MNSLILISEVKRLFKRNKKAFLKTSCVLWLLLTGLLVFVSFLMNRSVQEPATPQEKYTKPGIFRVYIEHEDGTVFTNSMIIEEYFLLPDVISDAEESTSVEITDALDAQVSKNFIKTQYDRGVLGVSRNGSTNIFTFIANVGEESENLAVANYFFEFLSAGNVSVLENKIVHFVSNPEIYDSYAASDVAVETSTTNQNSRSYILEVGVIVIVALVMSMAITMLIILIRTVLSPLINYSFNYSVSDLDQVFTLNQENTYMLERMISNIENQTVVIFCEFDISDILKTYKTDKRVVLAESLVNVDPRLEISNPIIIIQSDKTSKKWYKQISKELKMLVKSRKIIQVI